MRTFSQKQIHPQKQISLSFARSNTGIFGPNHHGNPLLHLQRTEAALWTAMGGTPKQIAREYRSLSFAKGGAFHATTKGGRIKTSRAKANPDCSASSVEVRNPS